MRRLFGVPTVLWLQCVATAAGLLVALAGTAHAQSGATTRASVGPGGAEANGISDESAISADGRWVAFWSAASNLVAGDTNGANDAFVYDRQTRTTMRVSVGPGDVQGNANSWRTAISADGRWVAFESVASNLVADDTNGLQDVFVRDRQTGTTTRVSVGSGGAQGNGHNWFPAISADGRWVAFESAASNLVADDTNGTLDVFLHDRETGTTKRVSVGPGGVQGNGDGYYPELSADGRGVAFMSSASNLVADDTNGVDDVFVYDRETQTTTRVSVGPGGAQGNQSSDDPAISADGRLVAFWSAASNLVAGDTNDVLDVFVHDRQTGTTTRVSLGPGGAQANGSSWYPSISADGRWVAFSSIASNLVAGDTNGYDDVFVHDRETQTTTRVSLGPGSAEANFYNYRSAISADGRSVSFESLASNLVAGDTNGTADVFVHQRQTGQSVPGDFDSDGTSDITVFRPSSSTWYTRSTATGAGTSVVWGGGSDRPVPSDYDGDGTADIAVFRPSTGMWYVRYTATGAGLGLLWGGGSDMPVPADFDGDGTADIAVFRLSTGMWYVRYTATGAGLGLLWGGGSDVPVPADFDGDGTADIAVFRPSTGTWYVRYTATGAGTSLVWGGGTDIPVAADYDGDGTADIAVFRPSTGTWYLRYTATGAGVAIPWGGGSDMPVPGDYDGDGRTDIAVFRPSDGTWYLRYSATGAAASVQWGGGSDIPILKRP